MSMRNRLISTVSAAGFLISTLPLAATASDYTDHFRSELESRVMVQLIADPELPVNNIEARSDGQTITLRGTVPQAQWQSRAETLAASVHGVAEVENALEVDS